MELINQKRVEEQSSVVLVESLRTISNIKKAVVENYKEGNARAICISPKGIDVGRISDACTKCYFNYPCLVVRKLHTRAASFALLTKYRIQMLITLEKRITKEIERRNNDT